MTRTAFVIAASIGLLLACEEDDSNPSSADAKQRPAPVAETPEPPPPLDAGKPVEPKPEPKPKPPKKPPVVEEDLDASVPEDATTADAALADAAAGDAMALDSGPLGPPGALRSLSIRLSGLDDDTHRFMQFRVVAPRDVFEVIGVIHEGLRTGTYQFDLPHSLHADQTYRLDFWVDHNENGGYTAPPADHAWSLPIPNGADDVVIDFASNTDFTDIERMPPINDHNLILSARDMAMFAPRLIDVRVIERASGRLAGRQVREIPGDTFDLDVGSVVHVGLDYQVDIAIDADDDGDYNPRNDPSWRLMSVATSEGLQLELTSTAPHVDVGF